MSHVSDFFEKDIYYIPIMQTAEDVSIFVSYYK